MDRLRPLVQRWPGWSSTLLALLLALAFTWPLARGLGRDIPADQGDPLLNCWILAWDAERLLDLASGDLHVLARFWDANAFHPEPLALAYSEHLVPQALQALPVYAVTRDVLLSYNTVLLLTYVLSALGGCLLVRELTGSLGAGLVAGLAFGFAPYRMHQLNHLQVLSSQWMPFALLGLRLHLTRGGWRYLAAGALAVWLQGLSCGYYLVYFSPFAAAFVAWEAVRLGRGRDGRTWAGLLVAGGLVAAATWPFVAPYLELRRRGILQRDLAGVYSADVYSYLTAGEGSWLWGEVLRAQPRPEGDLFPSFTVVGLAAAALAAALVRSARAAAPARDEAPRTGRRSRTAVAWAAAILALLCLAAAAFQVLGGSRVVGLGPLVVRLGSVPRALATGGVAALAVLALSPRARRALAHLAGEPVVFPLLATLLAFWLSLGPTVTTLGRPLPDLGLYGVLYEHVPGFDGLRVPARFAMVVILFLSVLAGFGAREMLVRGRRGMVLIGAAAAVFLLEAAAVPITVNAAWWDRGWTEEGLRVPPEPVRDGRDLPAPYRAIASLPAQAVLAELPFGVPPYEVRAMFYAGLHHRPILNGYSGAFPPAYRDRRLALRDPLRDPAAAWQALLGGGATHVLVHTGAWMRPGKAAKVLAWLEGRGSRPVLDDGGDVLLALPSLRSGTPGPGPGR